MIESLISWSNENAGFLTLVLFVVTLVFGWVSGIFRNLMHKPEFRIEAIPGPTLCTVIATGKMHGQYHIHRTAFSLYLRIANTGTAPASIDNIEAAFHWQVMPVSWLWFRYRVFWYWMKHPIITMEAFQYDFGSSVKTYPSLFQGNNLTGKMSATYLRIGQSVNGVVYFEHEDSWGYCLPAQLKDGTTKIRVAIVDTRKKKHKKTLSVPIVHWEEAKKYNPSFASTFATIRNDETITDFYETLNKSF